MTISVYLNTYKLLDLHILARKKIQNLCDTKRTTLHVINLFTNALLRDHNTKL